MLAVDAENDNLCNSENTFAGASSTNPSYSGFQDKCYYSSTSTASNSASALYNGKRWCVCETGSPPPSPPPPAPPPPSPPAPNAVVWFYTQQCGSKPTNNNLGTFATPELCLATAATTSGCGSHIQWSPT